MFYKLLVALPEIAEIDQRGDLGQPSAVLHAAVSLALGNKSRGQIVLVSLKDGLLIFVECALNDVEALVDLSARMNAEATSKRASEHGIDFGVAPRPSVAEEGKIPHADGSSGSAAASTF